MTSIFVATVSEVKAGTEMKSGKVVKTDTNGLNPVILTVVAGKCPNQTFRSGTVAKSMGIEVGKTYLFQSRETEPNEYGRQFAFTKLKEVDALEIIQAVQTLGEAQIVDVSKAEVSAITAADVQVQ